uniref:Uncharacterized protein n=1 Tax=Rhizophora mucronata TaxID=61149 RepID=A0A2P2Q2A6_RHIMU
MIKEEPDRIRSQRLWI